MEDQLTNKIRELRNTRTPAEIMLGKLLSIKYKLEDLISEMNSVVEEHRQSLDKNNKKYEDL